MRKFIVFIVGLVVLSSPQLAFANALLIEDNLPWEFNSNSTTLSSIGMPYTKISSSQIGATNLGDYNFVVYASDQNQPYYDNVAANFSQINNYVQNGGVLIAHSAIWGWHDGIWNAPQFLPGGVNRVQEYSNSVNVTDPAHPVISGPYGTVTQSEFQGWNYTTHGYFTDLVAGTQTVLDLNDPTKPIYIEYGWGSGVVRASMMTVEWGNNDPSNTRYIFRENEFYAAGELADDIDNNAVPEPASMLLMGMGSLAAAFLKRKKMIS